MNVHESTSMSTSSSSYVRSYETKDGHSQYNSQLNEMMVNASNYPNDMIWDLGLDDNF